MRIPNAYYLIVDVEATCTNEGAFPRNEMEIIEIGAVVQDAQAFEIVSEFQSFIKPVRHEVLTPFCTELTSITQDDVDHAPRFPEVIAAMLNWMSQFDDALFCSWGEYDRKQFEQDCQFHGIDYPFEMAHLNLKAEFSRTFNRQRRYGLRGALRWLGLTFEGTPHRGIDDVRNIARIVRKACAEN